MPSNSFTLPLTVLSVASTFGELLVYCDRVICAARVVPPEVAVKLLDWICCGFIVRSIAGTRTGCGMSLPVASRLRPLMLPLSDKRSVGPWAWTLKVNWPEILVLGLKATPNADASRATSWVEAFEVLTFTSTTDGLGRVLSV